MIEWGRGIFGIDAASRTFFRKSTSGLTLDESARLAAVIPSPLSHSPDANSRYVIRRKQIVLNRMAGRWQRSEPEEEPSEAEEAEQPLEGEIPSTKPVPDTTAKAPDGS